MELLVGEGDGPLKSHCVCPHEGRCLQKVMTRCRSGHGLIRKFVVSCVEIETSKVDSRGPDPLHPRSVRNFCFDYGALNCVQEREMEDSQRILCGFCSPGIAEGSPSAPTNVRLHDRPAQCFMLAELPGLP